jgi:hypothetical protein
MFSRRVSNSCSSSGTPHVTKPVIPCSRFPPFGILDILDSDYLFGILDIQDSDYLFVILDIQDSDYLLAIFDIQNSDYLFGILDIQHYGIH